MDLRNIFSFQDYAEVLRPMVEDTIVTLNNELKTESNVLVEGANATMLDVDFGITSFYFVRSFFFQLF